MFQVIKVIVIMIITIKIQILTLTIILFLVNIQVDQLVKVINLQINILLMEVIHLEEDKDFQDSQVLIL